MDSSLILVVDRKHLHVLQSAGVTILANFYRIVHKVEYTQKPRPIYPAYLPAILAQYSNHVHIKLTSPYSLFKTWSRSDQPHIPRFREFNRSLSLLPENGPSSSPLKPTRQFISLHNIQDIIRLIRPGKVS